MSRGETGLRFMWLILVGFHVFVLVILSVHEEEEEEGEADQVRHRRLPNKHRQLRRHRNLRDHRVGF